MDGGLAPGVAPFGGSHQLCSRLNVSGMNGQSMPAAYPGYADVWTLMLKFAFSRSGGENRAAIGIKETNLLGTGIAVELAHKSNVDRDSTLIKFMDRRLAGSWYSLGVFLAEEEFLDGRR